MSRPLRLGSRASALARWQAEHVRATLNSHGHACEIEWITTSGDRNPAASLAAIGGKGLFTREIEDALGTGRIDFAVHSLKDVPSELPPEFQLAAIMEREDARDALVAAPGTRLADLAAGARVGTSSLRRQAQLLALRLDLRVLPLRGNVDTRLRKLREGQYDALLLAAAGLQRLGLGEAISERLNVEAFCPCGGQGALALECRVGDGAVAEVLAQLHHAPTGVAVDAERALLRRLDCGCQAPVAAYARRELGGDLLLQALVASPDGKKLVRVEETARGRTAVELGVAAAERLLADGAGEILAGLGSPA